MTRSIKLLPVPAAGAGEQSAERDVPFPARPDDVSAGCGEEPHALAQLERDELTRLVARRHLIEALDHILACDVQEPWAFLLIGINDLPVTNEMFGFEVGDELIAAVARVLTAELDEGWLIGRYSSNKFGLLVPAASTEDMRRTAERLSRAVREARLETSACRLATTISIGGLLLPQQATSSSEALSRAQGALSRSRYGSFCGFAAYDPGWAHDYVRGRNVRVARDVVSALESGRMRLALQPIVSTATWQPVFHECLLRMELPEGRTIAAGKFIGIAEQLGLARLVDRRALELAVDLLHDRPDLHLALNVSGLTCTDHDWLVALQGLTSAGGLAERLTIEITETAAIQDFDHSVTFVDALKELGCRVAIDDFGAGYTSFRTLKHLAIDMVKIDGAFVRSLPRDSADQVFIKAMVELARSLNLSTVAEWVGDEATARLLADIGVDYLQGFHFGEPVVFEANSE